MDDFRCPVCRSLLHFNWVIDLSVAKIQTNTCPVCKAVNWIASGFPAKRITSTEVLEKPQELKITWDELKQIAPQVDKPVPQSEKTSAVQDAVTETKNFFGSLGSGIYSIGIWIVVVLVLVLLIKRRS